MLHNHYILQTTKIGLKKQNLYQNTPMIKMLFNKTPEKIRPLQTQWLLQKTNIFIRKIPKTF